MRPVGIGEVALGAVLGRAGWRLRLAPRALLLSLWRPVGLGRVLGLGFQGRLRLPDPVKPLGLVRHPIRHLVAPPIGAEAVVFFHVHRCRRLKPTGNLPGKLGFRLLHPAIAHRLVLRGVPLDLGAVQRHMPQLYQSRRPAQTQNLNEQTAEGRKVALAKVGNRPEVRPVHRRHRHEVEPFLAAPRHPTRRIHALTVGVQQKRRHHARIIRRITARLRVVPGDRRKIQLLANQVADKM